MVPRVERKLAAILALDVVGYSRLMAVDEAGTHARLKALRKDFIEPQIAEHHGRVVKLMAMARWSSSEALSMRSSAPRRSRGAWPSARGSCSRRSASLSASASTSAM
jgi:adenylate cyclase